MRKDPNTIYLFLSTLGKGLKQRITKANLTSSSSATGACKAVVSDWDEKEGL
jgi:hypothetical protein